jgi:hypothetical protein
MPTTPSLSLEILLKIAETNIQTYREMLNLPCVARFSLNHQKTIKKSFTTLKYEGNIQYHTLNGELHREDGPAHIDGEREEYWVHGELHREDGPAIIDGEQQVWYFHGKRH